jgi:uncharacterized protein (DUF1684 family)
VSGAADVRADVLSWDRWRSARDAELTGPRGDLALVGAGWFPVGEPPSLDAVAGALPATAQIEPRERIVGDARAVQHGWLAWDPERAARTGHRTTVFPYDPAYRVRATLVPADPSRVVSVLRQRGDTFDLTSSFDLVADIGGRRYAFTVFDDDDDDAHDADADADREVLLVFADPTNRSEDASERTYPSGRFLWVQVPAAARRGDDPAVVLDFNRAVLPPCAHSDAFNCPLPPATNRVHVPIRAGERTASSGPESAAA